MISHNDSLCWYIPINYTHDKASTQRFWCVPFDVVRGCTVLGCKLLNDHLRKHGDLRQSQPRIGPFWLISRPQESASLLLTHTDMESKQTDSTKVIKGLTSAVWHWVCLSMTPPSALRFKKITRRLPSGSLTQLYQGNHMFLIGKSTKSTINGNFQACNKFPEGNGVS